MTHIRKLSDAALQRRLETLLETLPAESKGAHPGSEVRRLLDDLHIHQIELEMQNRDLREALGLLEHARDRYADLYDFAPIGYLTLDRSGHILELNLAAAGMLGYQRARVLGLPLSSYLVSGQTPRLFRHLTGVLDSREKGVAELQIQPRGGKPLEVRLESVVTTSPEGEPLCRTVMIDITARKQAEAELRRTHEGLEQRVAQRTAELAAANAALSKSEARLTQAQGLTHVGCWETNLETGEEYWSDEIYRILGFEPHTFPPSYDRFLESVHQEDRPHVRELLRNALKSGTVPEVEFRLIRPDQQQRIVRSEGRVFLSADGRPLSVLGTVQDITEQREAEAQLRRAAAVFDNTDQGIMITDADGNIVSVNAAFTRITGYAPREILGKSDRILRSERQDDGFYQAMGRSLENQASWQGEVWNRRKDGQVYPVLENIAVVRDNSGRAESFVSVFSDISRIKDTEDRLQYLAHHDPLTGIPNRLLFEARLANTLQRAKRHRHRVALLCLDLDHFKIINDSLGHKAGDLVLSTAANRLRECLRSEDTVARFGGDEFTIVMDEIAHPEDAALLAAKMIEAIAQPVAVQERRIITGTSIGIAIFPDDADNGPDLYRSADAALYLAKSRGRGNYQFYTQELTNKAMAMLSLAHDLRQALADKELALNYQPRIDLKSGKVVGVEALLRWRHPRLGLLTPDSFLEMAEESGLIDSITEWVVREACAQASRWNTLGPPRMRVSVNLSARSLRQDLGIVDKIRFALAESRLPPELLEVEITEKALQTEAQSVAVLTRLRELGITLAIDDFGTGFSCLGSLKQLPVDVLKIDSSFIREILHDPTNDAIATAIIALGHSLGLRVVAEGVEDRRELALLRDKGCDEIQGYLISRPVTPEEVGALSNQAQVIA